MGSLGACLHLFPIFFRQFCCSGLLCLMSAVGLAATPDNLSLLMFFPIGMLDVGVSCVVSLLLLALHLEA